MRSKPFRTIALAVSVGLAGGLASAVTWAAAGKVLLVSGVATAAGASERRLRKGDEIDVGDIVRTDAGTRLQILMADGARIVLEPGTSVRIDEFAMPSKVTNPNSADSLPGKSVATLLSGRIDARAGAIGAITIRTHGDPVMLTRERSGFVSVDATGGLSAPPAPQDAEHPPELGVAGHTRLGLEVNLREARLPLLPQVSAAVSVPSAMEPAFVASTTERSDLLAFSEAGSLLQLNSMVGEGAQAAAATYLAGTATPLDFGQNGSSGIRWGRWSLGTASISTQDANESVDLRGRSLHWIAGPVFEARPILPTSGSLNFTLVGGTSPTDTLGHTGVLNAGAFSADFTAQRVNVQLSLDVNGYNWFAAGSGPLTRDSVRFGGSFGTVLVDGRISGSGAFSGFLSAGPLTPDQLDGAGLSYLLNADLGSLGTISGVAAFIPGSMVPLAPTLVERDVAYGAGGLSLPGLATGAATNSRADVLTDAGGNVVRFNAPLSDANATLALGLARNADTGFDALTGIRWGRWEGGAMDVTSGNSRPHDLSSEALHWIASGEFGAPPIVPQTGTATYTLVGNTDPTDTAGNTGVLGAATLSADFTNRLVSSTLALNIDGRAWYASGKATFPIGGQRLSGLYDDVRIDNLARGQGTIEGFFTQARVGGASRDGAGIAYNLADNARQLGVVSGVLAFASGGDGSVITPAPAGERDIAMVSPDFASGGTFVSWATPPTYRLDRDFRLVSMQGAANTSPADVAQYAIGNGVQVESDVSPLLMLRWGRWAGGVALVTPLGNQPGYSVDLAKQSLHWIEGADTAAPPVIPQFGSATYALMGGTSPTDRGGNVGVLHNASFIADFTNQTVGTSLDLTVGNVNVIASGGGSIGASAGLPAHQFTGTITSGVVSGTGATPQGSFSGFFSAPGGTQPGVPGGVGLTYTITDGQSLTVDGAAAFRNR